MSDKRLEELKSAVAEPAAEYAGGPVRITKLKISNYKFFCGEFELDCNANNVLVYGENGSGKSSVYRALEYLTKTKFDAIAMDKNIFVDEGEPLIEFTFSNGRTLIIHEDMTELPESVAFLKGLSVFAPVLDYKKLLGIHYLPNSNGEKVNVYDMLRVLFKNYPFGDNQIISQIREPGKYFDTLKKIVNDELLSEVNQFISTFDQGMKINRFVFDQQFADDGKSVEPVINIEIEFKENVIEFYHTFLNEARLSAIAISIYFAAIKKLLGTIDDECLKILVLDDLLISLDMNNRLILLDLLKEHFNDFQIFFFTHDKELFETYKNKMPWEKYELYLNDSEEVPKPILKKGSTDLERAKAFYAGKEYEPCALMIRKELEKMLKSYLPRQEQIDKNWNELDLAGLIGRAIAMTSGEVKMLLQKLDSDRKHILNPLSHDDDRNIYAQEVRTTIEDMEKLKALLN